MVTKSEVIPEGGPHRVTCSVTRDTNDDSSTVTYTKHVLSDMAQDETDKNSNGVKLSITVYEGRATKSIQYHEIAEGPESFLSISHVLSEGGIELVDLSQGNLGLARFQNGSITLGEYYETRVALGDINSGRKININDMHLAREVARDIASVRNFLGYRDWNDVYSITELDDGKMSYSFNDGRNHKIAPIHQKFETPLVEQLRDRALRHSLNIPDIRVEFFTKKEKGTFDRLDKEAREEIAANDIGLAMTRAVHDTNEAAATLIELTTNEDFLDSLIAAEMELGSDFASLGFGEKIAELTAILATAEDISARLKEATEKLAEDRGVKEGQWESQVQEERNSLVRTIYTEINAHLSRVRVRKGRVR